MRHRIHPRLQTKGLVFIFMGTIVLGFIVNVAFMRTWWDEIELSSHKLMIRGVERSYELTAPVQTHEKTPVPLVILLHGLEENAKVARYRTNIDVFARRYGFAVAYPNGIDRAWTIAPSALLHKDARAEKALADMDFIDGVADDLVKKQIADPRRVFLAGVSRGGQMVFLMACERPQKYAAMAAVIATITEPVSRHCARPQPMPMLILDATDDTLVPWAGIKDPDPFSTYLSVADTVDFWKRANRCSDVSVKKEFKHQRADDTTRVTSETFNKCAEGTQVSLYTLQGSGHQAPSTAGDDRWNAFLGPRVHDIETGDEMWKFFSQFAK